ncbi:MAG: NAD(+)/NADH kinase [Candidatus Paceibacterota bacterium]|jgi:NAD+ kinase
MTDYTKPFAGKRNVLVVYKKSAFDLAFELNNEHMISLIQKNDPSVAKLIEAHAEHKRSIFLVEEALKERSHLVNYKMVYRADASDFNDIDLVVTVGGDGTFLWASKFINVKNKAAIIGVNSAPGSSVGYYTACNAISFHARILDNILQSPYRDFGDLSTHLTRMRLFINGVSPKFGGEILNDVLFTAAHPADMTRYVLTTEEGSEEQKSSGIWFSTPTGSTAAMLSAGGVVQPWDDDRIQYLVREPYKSILQHTNQIQRLTHGFFNAASGNIGLVKIVCKMREGLVCPDGSTGSIPVSYGDVIEIGVAGYRLRHLGKK